MRPRVVTVARWAIALAVVGVLAFWLDLGLLRERLASVDVRLALPAVIGLVAIHLVAALSWRRLTDELAGIRMGWGRTVRLYYAAQALGTVTPANLGADVYRVVAAHPGPGRGRMARPVVIQRLTSILALVVLGALGALALPIEGLTPFVLILGLVGAVSAVLVVAIATGFGIQSGPIAVLAGRLGLVSDAPSRRALASALRDGFALGVVFHAASLLLGLILVAAVDRSVLDQPAAILGALAVARLSLAIPLSPNGLGIQEGTLAVVFVQLGLPAEVALAASLLNRVAFLLTAVLGSIVLMSRTDRPDTVWPGSAPAATPRPEACREASGHRAATWSGHADG